MKTAARLSTLALALSACSQGALPSLPSEQSVPTPTLLELAELEGALSAGDWTNLSVRVLDQFDEPMAGQVVTAQVPEAGRRRSLVRAWATPAAPAWPTSAAPSPCAARGKWGATPWRCPPARCRRLSAAWRSSLTALGQPARRDGAELFFANDLDACGLRTGRFQAQAVSRPGAAAAIDEAIEAEVTAEVAGGQAGVAPTGRRRLTPSRGRRRRLGGRRRHPAAPESQGEGDKVWSRWRPTTTSPASTAPSSTERGSCGCTCRR